MADRAATRGASTERPCEEIARLRLELAARRYDAFLSAVLAVTLRTWVARALGAARARVLGASLRCARSLAVRLAPPGTARRTAARAVVGSALRARRGAAPGSSR
ncbi:MAG TPA: hypothetical protein VIE15_06970, partial [Acidimicrobiales bacterium]